MTDVSTDKPLNNNERQSGIELLKIIAIILVVISHVT